MEIKLFLGTLGAVMLGAGMVAAFLYALFWGDWAQSHKGQQARMPVWWFAGAAIPPIIAALSIYIALY